MTEPDHVKPDLPQLDRTDDPRGGAVTWALLAVAAVLVVGTLLAVTWAFTN
jgi:hypothetical protein